MVCRLKTGGRRIRSGGGSVLPKRLVEMVGKAFLWFGFLVL